MKRKELPFVLVPALILLCGCARGAPTAPTQAPTLALISATEAAALDFELPTQIPTQTPEPTQTPTHEPESTADQANKPVGENITAIVMEMPESVMETPEGVMKEPENITEPEDAEIEMLACVIYQEAGGNACSDLCRAYVGDVVLNRVEDPRFPDTLEGVLTAEGQYGSFYRTGIKWPERAGNPGEAAAVERAYDAARALLSGEHSELYGAGYIWQAEFEQGSDVIFLDGLYFGR